MLVGGRREKPIGPVQAVVVGHGKLHARIGQRQGVRGFFQSVDVVGRRAKVNGDNRFAQGDIHVFVHRQVHPEALIESFLLKVRQDHGEHSRAVWPGFQERDRNGAGVRPVRVTFQRGPNREAAVGHMKTVQRQPDLFQVITAANASGGLAGGLHRRQQQRNQNADDRNHHQQLDERERPRWLVRFPPHGPVPHDQARTPLAVSPRSDRATAKR